MFDFSKLPTFNLSWNESERTKLTSADKAEIESSEVVQRTYGLAICFYLKGGGHRDLMLSRDCRLKLGDSADLDKGEVVTLSRKGDEDIYRWEE